MLYLHTVYINGLFTPALLQTCDDVLHCDVQCHWEIRSFQLHYNLMGHQHICINQNAVIQRNTADTDVDVNIDYTDIDILVPNSKGKVSFRQFRKYLPTPQKSSHHFACFLLSLLFHFFPSFPPERQCNVVKGG